MTKPPTKARRWGAGRVAFLDQKDLFRSKLEAGHSLSAIYADHGANLGVSYTQFTRYVSQYLTEKETPDGHQNGTRGGRVPLPPPPSPPVHGGQATVTSGTVASPAAKSTGKFTHDANGGNQRDDLI